MSYIIRGESPPFSLRGYMVAGIGSGVGAVSMLFFPYVTYLYQGTTPSGITRTLLESSAPGFRLLAFPLFAAAALLLLAIAIMSGVQAYKLRQSSALDKRPGAAVPVICLICSVLCIPLQFITIVFAGIGMVI